MGLGPELIQETLQNLHARIIQDDSLARAAVLMPLLERPGGLCLLMT